MRQILIGLFVLSCLAFGYWIFSSPPQAIRLIDAKAMPVEGRPGVFMVTLSIENDGSADSIVDAYSTKADMISIMNPEHREKNLIIPYNTKAYLSMDGAHFMMMGVPQDFTPGTFVPLTVTFAEAGNVATRVIYDDTPGMDHSGEGVMETPEPSITLVDPFIMAEEGLKVGFQTNNFTFVKSDTQLNHQPHHGHAHVYLNGLKLGRLFDHNLVINNLKPGEYHLRIGLYSNDHRPYMNTRGPVAVDFEFIVAP